MKILKIYNLEQKSGCLRLEHRYGVGICNRIEIDDERHNCFKKYF